MWCTMTDEALYVHHRLVCAPRTFAEVAAGLASANWSSRGGALYGVWRSQIGRPRDELNVISVWPGAMPPVDLAGWITSLGDVRRVVDEAMQATLRPDSTDVPRRQGNYAFRWFELEVARWPEFLDLCAGAWPGFEAAYDSQVIGLWRCVKNAPGQVRALLLTRRPNLAMWERSKKPADGCEAEVRRKLSRRYDLCDATWVYTTTLLTASDEADAVRWT